MGGAWGGGMRGGHASLRGGAGSEVGGSVSEVESGEGSESLSAEQEMGVEDADKEEEREERRRRESEEMEIFAALGSGASFDSNVTPVVEGIVGEEAMEMVMEGLMGAWTRSWAWGWRWRWRWEG